MTWIISTSTTQIDVSSYPLQHNTINDNIISFIMNADSEGSRGPTKVQKFGQIRSADNLSSTHSWSKEINGEKRMLLLKMNTKAASAATATTTTTTKKEKI